MTVISIEKIAITINVSLRILIRFSFFAVRSADGNAKDPKITIFCTTLLNNANVPYASGSYNRVRIGVVTKANIAMINLPLKNIDVSLKNAFSSLINDAI